ncbi:hypothetical protein P43SY_002179 [Pythium insidiosum]|uniref:HAUS augmin-like complex subunit 3 N-terminal domain-containing protein n=1 Tax=Pythium insidiosum TaxID=114742 RepID=A0AAD5LHX5_PYTIN|nr:hypothetical protein P43SY_002179 [Pythium insidiosum]
MATAPRGYGRAMVDLLASLGYHEAELRADQLEWLFGLPSMRVQAFLDWLLTSIRPRHSVRRQLSGPRDYEIYRALLRGDVGRGLLAGDALQRAELSCEQDWASQSQRRPLAGGDRDAASLDAMDAANSALELEIAALERKLRVAHERNDRLAKLVQRSTLDADCQRRREQQRSSSASTSSFTTVQSQLQRVDRRRRAQRQRALAAAEISPCVDAILHRLAGSLSTASSSAGAIVVSSSSRVHTTPALTLETSHSSQHELVLTALSSSSRGTARDSVAGESLLSVLLQREPSQQQWRTFLFHHSVADIEALEQQNLRALKARIPVIAGTANSTGSDCSRANACGEDVSMASPGPKMPRSRLRAQSADDPMASPTATARHTTAPPPSPWLHDSDPAHLDLREQDATLYNKCCVELDRLRRAFVVAERDALMADIQVARYECALRQLTTSRRLQYQQFQLMSREAIWAKKQILAASVEKYRQQLEDVVRREVPSKLEELADLQMTSVLLHSYEQKLWRQEHRFVQLKDLLGAFQLQHARLRLVHCLLDAERQQVLRLDAMFQTLVRQLNEVVTASELRVEKYDAIRGMESACGTLSDTYINQHDAVAQSIFQRLEALVSGTETSPSHRQHESQRQPTFDELVRLAELKRHNSLSIEESVTQVRDEWKRLLSSKLNTLRQLRVQLFGDSVSSTPMLLPSEVSEAMLSATASKDQTEQPLIHRNEWHKNAT